MIYRNIFQEENLPGLGLGTMRLPLVPGGAPSDIDQQHLDKMVDYAMENGINYFDTAWPYHESCSETAIGKSLSRYDRNSYYLADKFPGHQISSSYDPAGIFEKQLEKCGVEYFDFYLLHNVNNSSVKTYLDPQWKIPEYFIEEKRRGRIKHLGFSCHGDLECINRFLDAFGGEMEFCQIQLNYLDWTLQSAKEKYELLTERGLGVWVMEPVRGGKLAKLPDDAMEKLNALRPGAEAPEWAFRFLQGLPNVKMILSGMSNLDQVKANVRTFEERKPLNPEEEKALMAISEELKNAVPCTGCRYCCDGCPMGIEIPKLIALYNDCRIHLSMNISMQLDAVPEDRRANACIGCGQCSAICPQGIDVPNLMKEMDKKFAELPSWAEICRQREEAAKKNN